MYKNIFNSKTLTFLSFFLLIIIDKPIFCQNHFDSITDWYHVFFSHIDVISQKENTNFQNDTVYGNNKFKFTSSFLMNDFYCEKFKEINRKILYWRQINNLNVPVTLHGYNLILNAHTQIVSKEIDYDISSKESLKINHNSKIYYFSMSAEVWKKYLILLTGIGSRNQSNNNNESYHWGFRIALSEEFVFSYVKYNDYFKWNYQIGFQEPDINFFIPEYSQMNELEIKTRIFPGLTIKAIIQNSDINNDIEIPANDTYFLPQGICYRRQLDFEYNYKDILSFDFKYRSHENDIIGRFYKSQQSFGKLTKSIEFSEEYSPGISYLSGHHSIGVNFDWGQGHFNNRGHIESWPFTTTWIDLLGLRYNFKSNIKYRFKRFHIKYKFYKGDWTISANASYEILKPSGETRTWEPLFLVFGIQNLKIYDLSYTSLDGIYLGLKLSKRFGNIFQINYQVSQYIPIESKQYSENGRGNKAFSDNQRSVYGGGKHQVYFSFCF